ncbi:hypothetical protein OF83DRAFT_1173470 [Amylostereum chailletii]|nr:hypothetical protein OF83DRAFT_1173470 [Amylostereum chailletii]
MTTIADDPSMLQELCRYQNQELNALKQRLINCKRCSGRSFSAVQRQWFPAVGSTTSPSDHIVQCAERIRVEKEVESELKRLKQDNDALRVSLDEKEEELNRLRLIAKGVDVDIKPDIFGRCITTPLPPSEPEHQRQSEEGCSHLDGLSASDWETRYQVLRTKYKSVKASNQESKETLNMFHVELDKATALIDYIETEPSYHRQQMEQKLDDFLQHHTAPADPFPPVDSCQIFAQHLPAGTVFTTSLQHLVTSFTPLSKCPGRVKVVSGAETLFGAIGLSHILVLQPSLRFSGTDPSKESGYWQRLTPRFKPGQIRDLFFHPDAGYAYIGSYKCVSHHELDEAGTRRLRGFLPEKHGVYLKESLVAGSDLIPPYTTRAVRGLYGEGVVGITVLGLERIGFDQSLNDKALAMYQHPTPSTTLASEGSKRVREETTNEVSKRRKPRIG